MHKAPAKWDPERGTPFLICHPLSPACVPSSFILSSCSIQIGDVLFVQGLSRGCPACIFDAFSTPWHSYPPWTHSWSTEHAPHSIVQHSDSPQISLGTLAGWYLLTGALLNSDNSAQPAGAVGTMPFLSCAQSYHKSPSECPGQGGKHKYLLNEGMPLFS